MPMPTPRNGESHDEFMSRCMGDDVMVDDFPEQDQRAAVCQSQWDDREKAKGQGMTLTAQRKSFTPIEFKLDDADEGRFIATFSRFNVIDLDGDVTLPGAFKQGQRVRIAQWGHNWGVPIIGTGTISQDNEKAWVDGRFNLKTTAGRDHYEAVKDAGDLQEWSYGFDVEKWSIGQFEEREVRFLESLNVHEVSPVLLGAGIGTRTDAIKSRLDFLVSHGKALQAHREAVLESAHDLVSRYEQLVASDLKEGRAISTARRNQMADIADELVKAADALRAILKETEPKPKDDEPSPEELAAAKAARMVALAAAQQTLARLNGHYQ